MKKIILCSISGLLVSFICFASNAGQVWPTGHGETGQWYAEGLRYGYCYYITCYEDNNTTSYPDDFRNSIVGDLQGKDEYSNLWRQFGGTDSSTNFPKDQFMSGIRQAAINLNQTFNDGYNKNTIDANAILSLLPAIKYQIPTGFGLYARGLRDRQIYDMCMLTDSSQAQALKQDIISFEQLLCTQGVYSYSAPYWGYAGNGIRLDIYYISTDQSAQYTKGIQAASADSQLTSNQEQYVIFTVHGIGPNTWYMVSDWQIHAICNNTVGLVPQELILDAQPPPTDQSSIRQNFTWTDDTKALLQLILDTPGHSNL